MGLLIKTSGNKTHIHVTSGLIVAHNKLEIKQQ